LPNGHGESRNNFRGALLYQKGGLQNKPPHQSGTVCITTVL
jgi:hypothetical protein